MVKLIKKYQTGGVSNPQESPFETWLNANNTGVFKSLPKIDGSGLLKPLDPKVAAGAIADANKVTAAAGADSGLFSLKNIGSGFKNMGANFLKQIKSPAGIGAAFDIGSSLLGNKTEYSGTKGSITQAGDQLYNKLSEDAANVPGGQAAGAALKGVNFLGKALNKWTGAGTDGMTTTDAVLGIAGLNLTPLALINGWGGKKSHSMGLTDWRDRQIYGAQFNGYMGTQKADDNAMSDAGKKFGLFSGGARNRANKRIDNANLNRATLEGFQNNYELGNIRGNDMVTINNQRYQTDLLGGFDANAQRIGRAGLKLPTAKDIQDIRDRYSYFRKKKKENLDLLKKEIALTDIHDVTKTPTFKNGGSVNVIPEGALHARLNKMEGGGEAFTKKGIPVIDNNGEQQAEIENNEIIFRKEVTTKLEEYAKDGSDKAAIECGKLLAKEIIENTDDRTGLTKTLQKGGTFVFEHYTQQPKDQKNKKSDWKDHPDKYTEKPNYVEWLAYVNPDFQNSNYDLKQAFDNYDINKLENWRNAVNNYGIFKDDNPESINFVDSEGNTPNHLGSDIQLPDGTLISLKLGKDTKENPELIPMLEDWKANGYEPVFNEKENRYRGIKNK